MPTPVEEIVGQNYKYLVRFLAAVGAITGIFIFASDRARAFVDDRVESKGRFTDATLAAQSQRIERMENRLDEVRAAVIEIKANTTLIKQQLAPKEK